MDALDTLKGQRILVTGATGFVGRHVLAQGHVLGLGLHALSRGEQHSAGVRWWQGDLLNATAIQQILSQVRPDGILHLAASGVAYGAARNWDVLRVNVEGLAVLLDAIRDVDLSPHVVIAGSGFEYAPQDRSLREDDPIAPNSAYGVSKAAATQLARLYAASFPITVLRLFSLYGPGETEPRLTPYIIARARRGQPVELTPGEQVRDYSYVRDVAEIFWRALSVPTRDSELRILNVASGKPVTLRYFVGILADELRRNGLAPDIRFGARPYRPDEIMNYTADITLQRQTLGWHPMTDLKKGLTSMVEASL